MSGVSSFNGNKQVFRAKTFLKKKFRERFWTYCGESAYHMYIQGCSEESVKAGNCLLGMNELLNQLFLKMVEGINFGVVKIFVCITQELMKEMQFHGSPLFCNLQLWSTILHSKSFPMTSRNIIGIMFLTIFNYILQF